MQQAQNSTLSIESAHNEYLFESWSRRGGFADCEKHPIYSGAGRRYYAAVFGDEKVNASFAVMNGGEPLLIAACTANEQAVDHWGAPVRFFLHDSLQGSQQKKAIDAACTHLESLAERYKSRRLVIADTCSAELSPLGERCLARGYAASARFNGLSAIGAGEAQMRTGLRKSFKSLLNWGRTNLTISYVNAQNPDQALFQCYQDLHLAIAGRVTRPQASWDAMYEQIVGGHGEVVLGTMCGELVAGTLVLDGNEIAYYASGAYDRAHFDKPIAHWPLWLAMLNAAARGRRWFDLGELPTKGSVSDKEFSIGYFKRGFATTVCSELSWELTF